VFYEKEGNNNLCSIVRRGNSKTPVGQNGRNAGITQEAMKDDVKKVLPKKCD